MLDSVNLHFFSNIAGNPSGPPAALVPKLSVAFSISLYVNIMLVSWGLLSSIS